MKEALSEAVEELRKHDELKLIDKLHDCQRPKWERLLRNLVKELKDAAPLLNGCDIGDPDCGTE